MTSNETKPQVTTDLTPALEAFCRFIFKTPASQKEIVIARSHDIGKLIHSSIQITDLPQKRPFLKHPVTFILPVNQDNHHALTSNFISISSWGRQKVKDGIEYEYRKWIERRFELGYMKRFTQKEIINAILRALNVRNNATNFDAIKKIDYRNRRKTEEKRFFELFSSD